MVTGQGISNQVRESLSKQLALLAKASQKCKPCDLVKLSEAMVTVVRELRCN